MEDFKAMLKEYGPPVIGVLVLLIVAWFISILLGRATTRGLRKAKMEETLARFLGTAVRWGIMLLALVGCLGVFGVETTSFAALLGAAGLAIGLAFQGSLGNLAAGIMLLIYRPFKVGDVVNVSGQLGKVEDLTLFSTRINTPDNRHIIIPNSKVFGEIIENITHNPIRRVDVAVGVEYSADIDKTRQVLETVPGQVELTLSDPPPQIILLELGDSALGWQVRAWCNAADYWTVKDAMTAATKKSLDAAGLGIPFPQMDVHVKELPPRT